MSFAVRLGQAHCLRHLDTSDSTLAEAIQTVFPLEGHAVLEWNRMEFQLSYKYDLSLMMEDLLSLLQVVSSTRQGEQEVDWPSSGFPYLWRITWNDPMLQVVASSRDEPGATRRPSPAILRTTRQDFLLAWQPLLSRVQECLEASGYREEHITGMALLKDMSHATP